MQAWIHECLECLEIVLIDVSWNIAQLLALSVLRYSAYKIIQSVPTSDANELWLSSCPPSPGFQLIHLYTPCFFYFLRSIVFHDLFGSCSVSKLYKIPLVT